MFFITSLRGPAIEIDQYVHEWYSVAKFKATYAENVPSMVGKQQWDIVNPSFVLYAPVQGRALGRPRNTRIRSSEEGTRLGPGKRKCKRCGRLWHIARNSKNAVDPAFGEDQHWGVENALQTIPGPSTIASVVPSTLALEVPTTVTSVVPLMVTSEMPFTVASVVPSTRAWVVPFMVSSEMPSTRYHRYVTFFM
jgi:hypothetical protein